MRQARPDLSHSEPIRVILGSDAHALFDVRISAPVSGMVRPPRDISRQIQTDGTTIEQVRDTIQNWLDDNPHVEQVVIGHEGGRYQLAVLLRVLAVDHVREIHEAMGQVGEDLLGPFPMIHVLGPEQLNSSLLTAVDRLVVRPRAA